MSRSIEQLTLPPDVITAVQTGLSASQYGDENLLNLLLKAAHEDEGYRLEVLSMGVAEVLPGGMGLKGAQPIGWRIITGAGEPVSITVHTLARAGDDPLSEGTARLACVRRGTHLGELLQAIDALPKTIAASLSAQGLTPAEQYVVRLLSMPELLTEAFLVEPQPLGSGPQAIFPFHTLIPDFPMMTAYTEEQFIEKVRPLAMKWHSTLPKLQRDLKIGREYQSS